MKKFLYLMLYVLLTACLQSPLKQEEDEILLEQIEIPEANEEIVLSKKDELKENKSEVIEQENSIILKEEILQDKITVEEFDLAALPEQIDINKKIEEKAFSEKIIKIGLLVPLSGSAEEIGRSIYHAAEMAIFESTSENILLIPRDTSDDIETAVQAAKYLESEGVSILVGPLFASQAKAVQENLTSNLPIFSFTNDESVSKEGIWSFGFSPRQQIKAIVREINNNGIIDIAIIIPNTAYGFVALEALKVEEKRSKIKIKNIFRYAPEINNFASLNKSSQLSKNINYSGLLILASGQQLREIASRLQFMGADPDEIKYFGLSSWNSTSIFGEPALYGGSFVAPDQTAYEAFVSRYYNIYGEWPSEVSALGYDIVALSSLLISEATKESDIINMAIESQGFKGLFDFFKLSPNGKIYRKFVAFKVKDRGFIKIRDIMPEIQ